MKGSNYLETMAKLHTVVFDKTGTLTKGEFKVAEIHSVDGDEKKSRVWFLELAALAESLFGSSNLTVYQGCLG